MKHLTLKLLLSAGLLCSATSHAADRGFLRNHSSSLNAAAVAVVEAFITKGNISEDKAAAFVLRTLSILGINNILISISNYFSGDQISMQLLDRAIILAFLLSIRTLYNRFQSIQKLFHFLGIHHLPEQLTLERLNWIGAAFFFNAPTGYLIALLGESLHGVRN